MSPEGQRALVIGGVDHGENNRVVYLFTERGRLSAFAPGAKVSRRRFLGALELFTTIQVTFATRRRGELETLESAQVERSRLGIRADLSRIALASFAAELIGKVAPEGEASAGLFQILTELFDQLDGAPATPPLRVAFELRLLSLLGYEQSLDVCLQCGAGGVEQFLDFRRGGVFCGLHKEDARSFGPKTATWTAGVLASPILDAAAGCDQEWAEKAAQKLRPALTAFYSGLLDRPLKSEGLLLELGL
ncbi:MAG: DNA repair protein RecO [Deltaproteobacteria bacterium]|nr:DNA repair protein RecO [Deltaproteobacteria bacterium]